MSQAKALPPMAAIAAQYQTRMTLFTAAGTGLELVLRAEPRRFYLRFAGLGPLAVTRPLLPAPYPILPAAAAGDTLPQEWKWKDAPSITAGEWYAEYGAGTKLLIYEELYVGDL